jgi:hypothetical protein
MSGSQTNIQQPPVRRQNATPQPQAQDALDEVLSVAEAAALSGLAPHTLSQQAERGKLHARKVGHTWITTKYWLNEYLTAHARRKH